VTEVFYGPWQVIVESKEAYYSQRFTISGSANADGTYPGIPGTGPGDVHGSRWTIDLEWNDNAQSGWQPSDAKRTATYSLPDGLTVFIGADDNFEQHRDHDYNDMVLACTSLDPDHAPYKGTTPYEFTIDRVAWTHYLKEHGGEDPHRFATDGDDSKDDEQEDRAPTDEPVRKPKPRAKTRRE
jgi:hypothetical protein